MISFVFFLQQYFSVLCSDPLFYRPVFSVHLVISSLSVPELGSGLRWSSIGRTRLDHYLWSFTGGRPAILESTSTLSDIRSDTIAQRRSLFADHSDGDISIYEGQRFLAFQENSIARDVGNFLIFME